MRMTMRNPKPSPSRKQSVNLSVDVTLLRNAKALKLNLSRLLEERLAERVHEAGRERWLKENRAALDDYNRRIERTGVFSDGLRRF